MRKSINTTDLFQLLRERATVAGVSADTKGAFRWFQKEADKLGRITPRVLLRNAADKIFCGRMFLYQYDPRLKMKLKYYDAFPLVIPYELTENGWRGLNLHYLPYTERIRFFQTLLSALNTKTLNEHTIFRFTYKLLLSAVKYASFKPCLKRYLASNVKSKFLSIEPKNWPIAVVLPVAKFKKQTAQKIWNESRRQINA